MPQISKTRIWEFTKDFLVINLGLALYALGWAAFMLPYHITTGALTGVCAIIYYVTSFLIPLIDCIQNYADSFQPFSSTRPLAFGVRLFL